MELDASTPGELLKVLDSLWRWAIAFLNSSFSAALFGALFGSLSAYWLTRRAKDHDDKTQEIRFCNEGVVAAWNIGNAAMVLRKQHVRDLKRNFDAGKRQVEAYKEAVQLGTIHPNQPIEFPADLRKLPSLITAVTNLQKACENVSLSGKPTMIAYTLVQSIDQVNVLISEHSDLIDKFEAEAGMSNSQNVTAYFGLKHTGKKDTRFADTIDGIASYVDDCIWFADKVVKAFTAHGKELRGKSKRLPKVHGIKFPESELPDDKNYSGFI